VAGYIVDNTGTIIGFNQAQPGNALSAELHGTGGFKGIWNIPGDVPNALRGRNRAPVEAVMSSYKDGSVNGWAKGYFYWHQSTQSLHFFGTISADNRVVVDQKDVVFQQGMKKIDKDGNIMSIYY
jgi:hypothetical protein